ncbi:ADP-ribosylglycohydrolase family protein [Persephonella sp.]|uniref:ADP-ribosylglycohydrolase family protein n=1 Tax=Persephonella sp. TaxID=2060922 RepID=UPI002604870F|nr:ADP-ribosylglycohydrolase family protein [Persephonella sp.]
MKNKFRGALVGAAVGDSMGMCVEEIPMDEVILHYGDKITEICKPHPASPASFLKPGETSSEFELVKIVAESLADKGRLDIRDIIERYIDWYEKEELHSYVDPSFLVAIEALKEGRDIGRGGSSVEGTLPAIPIGMYHYTNPILAVEGTKAVVMLTHRNEIALDAASILAVAIGELLQGRFYLEDEYGYFIELLKTFVKQKETKFYLDRVKTLLDKDASYDDAIDELGNGSFALEAVSQALFIFLKTPENTESVIIHAVNSYGNYGGDTDSIGLIAGAFAGAYNGEETIPAIWKTKLVKYKDIVKLADRLYKVAQH